MIDSRRSLLGHKLPPILDALAKAPPGDVAELGVYRGGCTAAMATLAPHRTIHAFDTFEGMPADATSAIDVHQAGEFSDVGDTLACLQAIPNVRTHVGYFPRTTAGLEDVRFAFVHLDADQYASTLAGLRWFVPRMVPCGVIVLDDWQWMNCPGVERAVLEYFGRVPGGAIVGQHQLFLKFPVAAASNAVRQFGDRFKGERTEFFESPASTSPTGHR